MCYNKKSALNTLGGIILFDSSAFVVHPQNVDYLMGKRLYPAHVPNWRESSYIILLLSLFIILTIGLVIFTGQNLVNEVMLAQNSTTTQGTIIERSIEGEDDTTYWLGYVFFVNDTQYENRITVNQELYDKYPDGSRIDIAYATNDPTTSRLTEQDSLIANVFLGIFTLIWTAFFGVILFAAYQSYQKQNQLKKEGQIIKGEIISATGETDSDGNYRMQIKFTFRTPDATEPRLETHDFLANHLKKLDLPSEKTPVYIFYADKKTWEIL